MLAALQIGDTSIPAEQLPELLNKYRLVPQLAKELILDRELAAYKNTEEEHLQACKRFYQQNQLNTDLELDQWLQQQQMTRADLSHLIDRELRLQQFKTNKWEVKVESHFCQRKVQIDQVVFSMIRVKEIDVAEEIFFRIHSGEATFMELAPRYSEGTEAKTKGISGPVELGKLDPNLAGALVSARPEEVLPPMNISNWWVIVQLEAILPAQLDEATRQRLTEELFTIWVNDQVQKYVSASAPTEQHSFQIA
jgi:parvulin-like peptidyl-prolyl isomerase